MDLERIITDGDGGIHLLFNLYNGGMLPKLCLHIITIYYVMPLFILYTNFIFVCPFIPFNNLYTGLNSHEQPNILLGKWGSAGQISFYIVVHLIQ